MKDEPPNSDSSSESADLADVVPGVHDESPAPTRIDSSNTSDEDPEIGDFVPTPGISPPPPDAPFSDRLKYFLKEKLTRKEFIIGSIVFIVLLGGAIAFGVSNMAGAPEQQPAAIKPKPTPVPTVSPLTGLPVTAAQAKRPITGVMIENTDFARPQSGLSSAGVVFEAIAEAGITRFLALFQEATPNNIGPIRSARPYFLEWALGFDASLSHVGGSPEALNDIKAWHVKDIGEFTYGSYYHRISSRAAPHNMYTSMANLNAIEKLNHWTTSHFTGFLRKKDDPAKSPAARTINFDISYPDFNVRYQYDPKKNAYLRWEGGAPHTDTAGHQLEPKVVIGLVMPYSLESDGYHSMYNTIGTGKAYFFQDGNVVIGTWTKSGRNAQFVFKDGSGQPVRLNAGQTWITASGSASDISYKP